MKAISLILIVLAASPALAAPAPAQPVNFGPRILPTFTTTPTKLVDLAGNDAIAIAALHASLASDGLPLDSMRVSSSHTNKRNGVTHVYLQQTLHGLDVDNAVANVNVKGNQVVSFGETLFRHPGTVPVSSLSPKLSPSEAVQAFVKFLNREAPDLQATPVGSSSTHFVVSGSPFAAKPIQAQLKYIQTEDGASVRLVWELLVEMADSDHFFDATVDTETGQVLSNHDFVSDLASYNVYPFGTNDPTDGDRLVVVNPEHPVASPYGWHSQGILGRNFTDTQGNNVRSQSNPLGGQQHRPDGGQELTFEFPIDLSQHPREYVDAAVTNLFYWSNIIHDFYYIYGFDEEAGNFQTNNFDRGGRPNDAVVTHAQDGSGTNNANFRTLPDGQEGLMRMYLWTGTPYRDGDLDGGIVVHEYSHGLSIRLTGGPANVACLSAGEGGGMGEGWGDIIATVTRTTSESTRRDNFAMGSYAAGDPTGIRKYVYSTDMETNPSTYGYLGHAGYTGVHAKGEVWAVMLYEVYWNLVVGFGFQVDWFNAQSSAGNTVFIQLLLDGMKLQPCEPRFVHARDAILQADELNYGGEHKCAIWKGFGKRGLGVSTVGSTNGWWAPWNGVEAFDLPAECE